MIEDVVDNVEDIRTHVHNKLHLCRIIQDTYILLFYF